MRSRFSYVTTFAGSGRSLNVRNVMSVVSTDRMPPDQRLAEAEQDLDRLERLDRPDDAGQHAEHAGLGAARGELGRRRLGHHVAVGRALLRMEHADHALEAEDRAVHDGDAELHAGVVEQVARREVVGAVDDDVVAADDVEDVVRRQARVVGDDVDVGVDQR